MQTPSLKNVAARSSVLHSAVQCCIVLEQKRKKINKNGQKFSIIIFCLTATCVKYSKLEQKKKNSIKMGKNFQS